METRYEKKNSFLESTATHRSRASRTTHTHMHTHAHTCTHMHTHAHTHNFIYKYNGYHVCKKQFFDKYGHAPQSAKQNQEYHDLMKKYVGHVDISVEKILGKGAIKQARTQKKRLVRE